MASLFAPKAISNPTMANSRVQTRIPIIQNDQNSNAIDYAQSMIKRSGGDAKAAFYLAAKEKGVNPDEIIDQVKGMGDLRFMAEKMLMSNPKAMKLANLFSMIK